MLMLFSSSTVDGSMRAKNTTEPSSPLSSPDFLPFRLFVREGPVQLSTVSGLSRHQSLSLFVLGVWFALSVVFCIVRACPLKSATSSCLKIFS